MERQTAKLSGTHSQQVDKVLQTASYYSVNEIRVQVISPGIIYYFRDLLLERPFVFAIDQSVEQRFLQYK